MNHTRAGALYTQAQLKAGECELSWSKGLTAGSEVWQNLF